LAIFALLQTLDRNLCRSHRPTQFFDGTNQKATKRPSVSDARFDLVQSRSKRPFGEVLGTLTAGQIGLAYSSMQQAAKFFSNGLVVVAASQVSELPRIRGVVVKLNALVAIVAPFRVSKPLRS
jgi:hypothetical protein